jgi:HlyD family secretion protein
MLRKKLLWIIGFVLLLVAAGGVYYYKVHLPGQKPTEKSTVTTVQATRGNLIITAFGSGVLTPASEIAVGFRTGGLLTEVLVQVGDKVEAGQVIARIDDTDAQSQVTRAQLSLQLAELALEDLAREADPADIAAATAAVGSAQYNLDRLLAGPTAYELQTAKLNVEAARNQLYGTQAQRDAVKGNPQSTQASINSAEAQVLSAEINVQRAILDQERLTELASEADIALARSQLAQAQATLNALLAGASASDLATAEINVAQARLNLKAAQRDLNDTTLVAAAPGTVVAVGAAPGQPVGTQAIFTLADLSEPQVQFWVEQSDFTSVVPGNAVMIVFEAMPDLSFLGEIVSVNPTLVNAFGTPAVQSYASVELGDLPVTLLSGMNATVEIVAGEARDAVLVPVQALQEVSAKPGGPKQYIVYVASPDGKSEKRAVTVGLRDFVSAEILSGLQPGESVIVATKVATEKNAEDAKKSLDKSQPVSGK